MSPMQQIFLGLGAVAKKTYVDDIFSTFLYKGTGSSKTVTTGIDQSGEGSLTWIKKRNGAVSHQLFDTVRGAGKVLYSDLTSAGGDYITRLSSFTSTGFTLGNNGAVNASGDDYSSWSFRKAPGFFDVVQFTTSNSTNQRISHSLGSIPGMIIIKNLVSADNWLVYHRELGRSKWIDLANTDATTTSSNFWGTADPTSTDFGFNSAGWLGSNSYNFIAYVFAGGESTAATARSVEFDGSSDKLSLAASDDFHLTGDFTIEGWFYPTGSSNEHFWSIGEYSNGGILFYIYSNKLYVQESGSDRMLMDPAPPQKQWSHIALVRSGSTINLYINGTSVKNWTYSNDYGSSSEKEFYIGGSYGSVGNVDISNLRVVKGTAVYTSSFRPSTEPLTNITNTKLLCCNNSSVTGSTVTPGTISSTGNPTASTDSPFDDPAGFVFGDSGTENVIKTGSYVGNGSSSTPPEVYLGWEPQWVMVKRINGNGQDWVMVDSMRGMFRGLSQTPHLRANSGNAEQDTSYYRIDVSSGTGFAPFTTDNGLNGNGDEYIYIACRRPDGYVGKPPELGTGVFALDTGAGSSTIPNYDSNFPVDFATEKLTTSSQSWFTSARLIAKRYLETDTKSAETSNNAYVFDSNVGWLAGSGSNSSYYSVMWKRHAGFDVVTYEGNGVQGRDIPHSLGVAPNMMWVKNRTRTAGGGADWNVYVSGITHLSVYGSDPDNRGNNPVSLKLNDTDNAQFSGSGNWDHTHPTSTHFRVGDTYTTNQSGEQMIAFLFASVDGISKVGSYTGNGSTSGPTITTGFSPRFIIIKRVDASGSWFTHDTLRGLSSGSSTSPYLRLDVNNGQTGFTFGTISSTGFTLATSGSSYNASGGKYIYYSHA